MTMLSLTILIATASVGAILLHEQDTTCNCKNWKTVYESGDAPCGASNEFYFIHGSNTPDKNDIGKGKEKFNNMICTEFFEVFDGSTCLNINMGKDEGTWCYTDPECKQLNMGSKVPNTRVAWKKCKGDPDFRYTPPEELFKYAKEHDLWFAYLHKMSYPGDRASEAQTFALRDFIGQYPQNMATKINKLLVSTAPYSFDTNGNGTVPHVIIHGRKTYEVNENPDKVEGHPGTRNILKCINGCEN